MSDASNELPPRTRELLALGLVPGLGPQKIRRLLDTFGSVENVLLASASEIAQVPHISQNAAAEIKKALDNSDVDAELERMKQHRVTLLSSDMDEFPQPLTHLPDPPVLLYCRGQYQLDDDKAVAIVGSRRCTSYGKRVAERLAADLARRGYTIVSGLARGIDGAAHRGALQAKGRTIAVLAGGLSKIYPPEHKELADQVEANGCLLTEAPMTRQPLPGMFPVRNRLISGLSKGVIVVEAPEQSGSLITARLAAEQGRDVFMVPGPVDSVESSGTLKWIRDGAKLIRNADDVIEDLEGITATNSRASSIPEPVVAKAPPRDLSDDQKRIWKLLEDQTLALDVLSQRLQMPVQQLSQELMMMEMKRAVRRLPGNQYERV